MIQEIFKAISTAALTLILLVFGCLSFIMGFKELLGSMK
jgi:hypothetical protein